MRFGMDMGGTNVKVGVFDDSGRNVEFEEKKVTEFTEQGKVLENLITFAQNFIRDFPVDKGGLAIKGLVNTDTGYMEDDIGAGALFSGVNLRKAFSEALQIPFFVENDARAYAWGELKFGAGQGSRVMVCMTLGTGLGCALVNNQTLYQGADPLGGILGGHISVDRHGPSCPCGQRGCLELYCSATAFAEKVRENHPELVGEKDILPAYFKMLGKEAEKYRETLHEFQETLSIGVVNVIHAYGPDQVVIGGGLMNSSQFILPRLIQLVHERAWTVPRGMVKIMAAALGNRAAALGVAFHPRLEKY